MAREASPHGAILTIAPKNKAEEAKLALHLRKDWLRPATPEDRQRAFTDLSAAPAPETNAWRPSALRKTSDGIAPAGLVQDVPLDRIRPDPTQPRKDFAAESMRELVDSIRDLGVQQAVQLRPMSLWRQVVSFVARQWVKMERGDGHESWNLDLTNFWRSGIKVSASELLADSAIIERLTAEGRIRKDVATQKGWEPTAGALAPLTGERTLPGDDEWLEIVYGERRWRGSQEAGKATIPAKVSELSDIEAAELQALENLKRANLLPLEVLGQYRKLLDTPGGGIKKLESLTGLRSNTIYGKLKLLDLPPEASAAYQAGTLGESTAERIGRLTGETQAKAVQAILHPQHWRGNEAGVLTDANAKQAIEEIQRAEKREVERVAIWQGALDRKLNWLEPDSKWYRNVFGHSYYPTAASGLVELKQSIDGDGECRTYAQVLAKKGFKAVAKEIKPTTATIRNHELVELYPAEKLRAALIAAGLVLTRRKAAVNNNEAIRRRRDKRMKEVLGTAALVISAKAQALTPRIAQNPETEAMWRALALGAVAAMSNDDLRAFVRHRQLDPVLGTPYAGQKKGSPEYGTTARQFIATQPTSALAGIVAELLLVRGAWWSHNLDFSRSFRRDAAVFGVDLRRLKIEAGASEEEVDEEEASNRKFNDEEDDSADIRTTARSGELKEAA